MGASLGGEQVGVIGDNFGAAEVREGIGPDASHLSISDVPLSVGGFARSGDYSWHNAAKAPFPVLTSLTAFSRCFGGGTIQNGSPGLAV